ncbi:hypothetical protein DPM19_24815 [Actinomadura craniellae]|uniref:ABC3 transporter permease C-terminal domain-containing protein n=1 Tax=Actinomadura craniellae TaxID=2231787 RepID=A0A365H008_9ACTN|nr:FtsX-like permease family protein [Actinomadura craniellae]RAY12376.1 hypothetical protein DPM19_24815 [Actinomadura craniellae]
MSGSRAVFRLARRNVWRAKGRSALALCMIGLPVLAIVALAVLFRTHEWTPAEAAPYELGRADARLEGWGSGPIKQDAGATYSIVENRGDPRDEPWTTERVGREVAARYGPGARVLPVLDGPRTAVKTPRGRLLAEVTQLDLRDPMARGILRVTAGRPPATAGEVAVSVPLRTRGFGIGTTIEVDRQGTRKLVVGHVEDPRAPGRELLQTLPGALPGGSAGRATWLVSTGRPVGWNDVLAFNRIGISVFSRAVAEDPPPAAEDGLTRNRAEQAVVALAIAMIMLEVVLLAGPAFAVGLRRQRRRLALVAANGGDRRRLRTVVLAEGCVVGAAAAVLGAAAGIGLAALAVPVVEHFTDVVLGPFEIPWRLVAIPMVLGTASGLLAAYLPARQAARMDVVAALAGRRDGARAVRGKPVAGIALIVVGVLVCAGGAGPLREYGPAAGAVALILGAVLAVPWAVALAGRGAGPLPLPLRLAVRDGARNRGRTAPVVAAILAAVAGLTVLAIGGASDFAQRRAEYTDKLPRGSALLQVGPDVSPQDARAALAAELPGAPVGTVRTVREQSADCADSATGCLRLELGGASPGRSNLLEFVVGGVAEARFLLGREEPEVTAALAAGRAVVFGARPLPGGTTTVSVFRTGGEEERLLRKVKIPALGVAAQAPARALLPPETARRLGVETGLFGYSIDRAEHRTTPAEEARVGERMAALDEHGPPFYVERGFTETFALPLLLLGAVGTVLAFGGALIATGLSAADARPDLVTLAAVGARPRTRRLLMMGQAGFVAALGCWLGIAAGLVPGVAVAVPLTSGGDTYGAGEPHGVIVDVPWQLLGVLGVAVPLAAALVAGLFTRSRLPLVRRATG